MTEFEQVWKRIKMLDDETVILEAKIEKQQARIERLEQVVGSIVKWHTPEGFTVEGLIHRG